MAPYISCPAYSKGSIILSRGTSSCRKLANVASNLGNFFFSDSGLCLHLGSSRRQRVRVCHHISSTHLFPWLPTTMYNFWPDMEREIYAGVRLCIYGLIFLTAITTQPANCLLQPFPLKNISWCQFCKVPPIYRQSKNKKQIWHFIPTC